MHSCASTTTGRGGPHGQPVVVSGQSGLQRFSIAAFCALFGPRALPMLGHFRPLFAIFFDPHDLKTFSNHMCLNLQIENLQKHSKQAKTHILEEIGNNSYK